MKLKSLTALLVIPAAFVVAAPGAHTVEATPTPVVAVEAVQAGVYEIDAVHSELSFRIRHLIGRVAGTFNEWSGTLKLDPDNLAAGSVDITVQTASINTLVEPRDDHLRTPDFFAVEEFPTMTFSSNRIEAWGNELKVHGDLTIRGTTRPVVLDATYLGLLGEDPWGMERVAFLATATIDRQDFGVSFNEVLETMTMIGDEVQIEIAIEAVRQ